MNLNRHGDREHSVTASIAKILSEDKLSLASTAERPLCESYSLSDSQEGSEESSKKFLPRVKTLVDSSVIFRGESPQPEGATQLLSS